MPEDRLLTVGEVCARFRCSKAHAYELLRTGQLPSLKIGRSRRVPSSALDKLIAERTSNGWGGAA